MEDFIQTSAVAEKKQPGNRVMQPPTDSRTSRARTLLLGATDVFILSATVLMSRVLTNIYGARGGANIEFSASQISVFTAFVAIAAGTIWLTRWRTDDPKGATLARMLPVVGAISFASMLTAFIGQLLLAGDYNLQWLITAWALSLFTVPLGELIAQGAYRAVFGGGSIPTDVILVGDADQLPIAKQRFSQQPLDYRLAGIVTTNNSNGAGSNGIPRLGSLNELPEIIANRKYRDGELMISTSASAYTDVCSAFGSMSIAPVGTPIAFHPVPDPEDLGRIEDLEWPAKRFSWRYERVKRIIDIALATASLVIASPILAIIAILIKLDSPGPIFFGQVRVGRNGRLFKMYKFRSMRVDAEEVLEQMRLGNDASGPMFKLSNDPRITRLGRTIRRLSLDELPQLFNVIQGTMSIIGARPPLPREVKDYKPWHFKRLEGMPGITGLWQVTRGDNVSFDEMVTLDLEYVETWSIWRDISILARTIPAMLRGQGAY